MAHGNPMVTTAVAQMSFLGAGIFCAYLVFDTWRIATVLKVDDYVEGAIQCLSCDQGPGMGFP